MLFNHFSFSINQIVHAAMINLDKSATEILLTQLIFGQTHSPAHRFISRQCRQNSRQSVPLDFALRRIFAFNLARFSRVSCFGNNFFLLSEAKNIGEALNLTRFVCWRAQRATKQSSVSGEALFHCLSNCFQLAIMFYLISEWDELIVE